MRALWEFLWSVRQLWFVERLRHVWSERDERYELCPLEHGFGLFVVYGTVRVLGHGDPQSSQHGSILAAWPGVVEWLLDVHSAHVCPVHNGPERERRRCACHAVVQQFDLHAALDDA